MRSLILLTLVISLPSFALAYAGEATNVYSWGHANPLIRTPQQLAAYPALQYSELDRPVIETEDGIGF